VSRRNASKSDTRSSSASGKEPSLSGAANRERALGELETPKVKVAQGLYAPGRCIPLHSHAAANFIYIIEGTHWSGYSRGGDICAPGTVRYLPAGEPHENYFPVGSRCLEIELRQPIFELASEYGHTIRSPGELAHPSAGTLAARLYREFLQRDDVSLLDIEEVTLQLLLTDREESPARRCYAPPWLLRIREMLREEERPRTTLAELSRCVGRHPVQISRQFHRHFGCTIGEYIRRVRIARAQSLLSLRGQNLAEIALACGFSDQSHFTTAFRRLTGMSPHCYRRFRPRRP